MDFYLPDVAEYLVYLQAFFALEYICLRLTKFSQADAFRFRDLNWIVSSVVDKN